MVVTFLNYFTIIDATSVIDIVMNFLALAVIAELDDYFYAIHDEDEFGVKMVRNKGGAYDSLYTIETTTSDDAEMNTKDLDLKDINKFKPSLACVWYEQLFGGE